MKKLQRLMSKVSGGTFISIDTETVPVLKGGKSNPFQGRVVKRTIGSSVMVFQNKTTNAYENMVKRRLEQEGKDPESFQLSVRQWGTRVPNTPFVVHGDKEYLEVIFIKAGKTSFYVNGKDVDRGDIPGLEDKEESHQGNLSSDNKVIIRTYSLNSITAITINKTRWYLKDGIWKSLQKTNRKG